MYFLTKESFNNIQTKTVQKSCTKHTEKKGGGLNNSQLTTNSP